MADENTEILRDIQARLDAIESRLPPPNSPTLEFIGEQLNRVLHRQSALEAQVTVLTGMAMRVEGAIEGLVVESRGMFQLINRLDRRISKLEN